MTNPRGGVGAEPTSLSGSWSGFICSHGRKLGTPDAECRRSGGRQGMTSSARSRGRHGEDLNVCLGLFSLWLIVAVCTAMIAWVLVTLVFKFAGAGPDHQLAGLHLARQPGLPGAPAGWSPTSHQHHGPGGTGRRPLDRCAATVPQGPEPEGLGCRETYSQVRMVMGPSAGSLTTRCG